MYGCAKVLTLARNGRVSVLSADGVELIAVGRQRLERERAIIARDGGFARLGERDDCATDWLIAIVDDLPLEPKSAVRACIQSSIAMR